MLWRPFLATYLVTKLDELHLHKDGEEVYEDKLLLIYETPDETNNTTRQNGEEKVDELDVSPLNPGPLEVDDESTTQGDEELTTTQQGLAIGEDDSLHLYISNHGIDPKKVKVRDEFSFPPEEINYLRFKV